MFNLTTQSTTKLSILVTSFVLLAACSAKQIKSESDAFTPTPEPITDSTYHASENSVQNDTTYNETIYSDAKSSKKTSFVKKSKKKTKYAKAAKKAKGHKVAKRSKRKAVETAAVAQIDNGSTPTNGGTGLNTQALQEPVIVAEPVAPPPPFIEPVQSEGSTSWAFWLVGISAVSLLGFAGFKARKGKGPGRRLVYNS